MEIWKHYETLWIMKLKSQVKKYQKYSKIQIISTSCTSAGSFLAMWTFAILCKTCASLGTSWWVGDVWVKRPCAAELPATGVPPFVQKCPVLRATISQPGTSRAACRAHHGHVMPCLCPPHQVRPPTCTHLPQAARPRWILPLSCKSCYIHHATQWGAVASPRRSCDFNCHVFICFSGTFSGTLQLAW